MKNIVLVIDWQNRYFRDLKHVSKYMHGAVNNTSQIIKKARENGDQIVWIGYGGERLKLWSDSEGSIVPELQTLHQDGDPEFVKHTCDSFELSEFDEWISSQDFDRLIFTGYHVDDCVKKTLISAINKKGWGDKCLLVEDACGTRPEHKTIMAETFNQMSQYCDVTVCSTNKLLKSYNSTFKSKKFWGKRKPRVKTTKGKIYTACDTLERIVRTDTNGYGTMISEQYRRELPNKPFHTANTLRMLGRSHDLEESVIENLIKNPDCGNNQDAFDLALRQSRLLKIQRNAVNAIA